MTDSRITYVRVSNQQRIAKTRRRRQDSYDNMTPPKYLVKTSVYNQFHKYQKKCGYDFDPSNNKTLKWLKQDFDTKLFEYLGARQYTKKQGRMDKI